MRIILLVAGFLFALGAGLVSIRTEMDRLEIEARETRHVVGTYYVREVDKVLKRKEVPNEYRVAFLGNSMIMSYPKEQQIANLLQAYVWQATRGRPPVHVMNLGMAGTGPFDYYFMADVIAKTTPHLVIIQFDLASSSHRFRASFSRPENAGWLESTRIAKSAPLPLS